MKKLMTMTIARVSRNPSVTESRKSVSSTLTKTKNRAVATQFLQLKLGRYKTIKCSFSRGILAVVGLLRVRRGVLSSKVYTFSLFIVFNWTVDDFFTKEGTDAYGFIVNSFFLGCGDEQKCYSGNNHDDGHQANQKIAH